MVADVISSGSGIDVEMEFVRQAKTLAEKRKKTVIFGGGKLLPPINPTDPQPEQITNTLRTKREMDPQAPKLEPERFEMHYPLNRRKNKFIKDSDFPLKQLSKSLNGPLRQNRVRKGLTRSNTDLSHSIDEQLLSMKKVSDDIGISVAAVKKSIKTSNSMHQLVSKVDASHKNVLHHRSNTIRVPTGENTALDTESQARKEDTLALNSGRK